MSPFRNLKSNVLNRLLLDTHTFLWWVDDAPLLSDAARSVIAERGAEVWLSIASVWEMAIKQSLSKLQLPGRADRFAAEHVRLNRFRLLPVDIRHTGRVVDLPFHHRDPFDRLLIAQALEDNLVLVTADAVVRSYGVPTVW